MAARRRPPRSQQQRNREAQARLRRAGQPTGRLKGAEYRWRQFHAQAIASAAGVELSASQAAGKPRRGAGELSVSELRALGQVPPARQTQTPRKLPAEPRRTRLGAGADIHKSTSWAYMRKVLRGAAADNRWVQITITAQMGPDGEIRTRKVGGYEYDPIEHMERQIARAKGRKGVLRPSFKTVRLVKKPEFYITVDGESITGGGIDPKLLVDYFGAYIDWLAAVGDLWAMVPS